MSSCTWVTLMLNELQLVEAVTNRIKAVLPAAMQKSVQAFPGKPEQITDQIIRTQHPRGLFSVRYMESEAAGNGEYILIGVYCWAISPEMESRLSRAAKIAVSNYSPGGCSALQLHKDEPVVQENGVMVRVVSFRCQVPTERVTDPAAAIAALNL